MLSLYSCAQTLGEVAKCVGNSDNGIRTAALGCLQKVYSTIGDGGGCINLACVVEY